MPGYLPPMPSRRHSRHLSFNRSVAAEARIHTSSTDSQFLFVTTPIAVENTITRIYFLKHWAEEYFAPHRIQIVRH